MDPKLILLEAGIAVARYLWHKAHGDDTKPDEAKLAAAGRKVAEMGVKAAALELERDAAAAGMQLASNLLAKNAAELLYELERLETDPSPKSIPSLLDMEEVKELSPFVDSDDIPTKPGDEP